MTALANLAKYQGRYDSWLQIRQHYSLKWTSGNESLHAMQRFFNPDLNLDVMLQQIRLMIEKLPFFMGQIVRFGALVGLRPAEVIESVRLINDKEAFAKYYDPEQMTLAHWKFPQLFLRSTKKAFLSFATPAMLAIIIQQQQQQQRKEQEEEVPSYNAIRLACRKRGITCDMRFCRKIHATHLHQSGIPVEIIDALQGRTPTSVFAKYYYRPSLDYREKVLTALEKLMRRL